MTCGESSVSRSKLCQDENQLICTQCSGESTESKINNLGPCCVWDSWGEWSSSSQTCGTGSKQRVRHCKCGHSVNPATKCGGGETIERIPVSLKLCCSWTIWGAWSSTSATCGDTYRDRLRSCKCGSVTSSAGCSNGSTLDKQKVKQKPCCDWTSWGAWSSLSVTCGGGYVSRSRQCSGNNLNKRLI